MSLVDILNKEAFQNSINFGVPALIGITQGYRQERTLEYEPAINPALASAVGAVGNFQAAERLGNPWLGSFVLEGLSDLGIGLAGFAVGIAIGERIARAQSYFGY